MLRGHCRQATRRLASYKEEALVYGNQRAYEASAAAGGSLDGKGRAKPLCDTDREHASMPHQKPDKELASMPHQKPSKVWGSAYTWHLARFISMSSAIKRSVQVHGSYGLSASPHITTNNSSVKKHPTHGLYACNLNFSGSSVCLNFLKMYSSSVKVKEQTNEGKEGTDQNDAYVVQRTSLSSTEVEEQTNTDKEETNQEDVFTQMLEMMGFLVDGDISAAANELRQAQQEMLVHMRRCSRALFAVGAVHLIWGGMMFFALESPVNHAILTEVCMSSLVICGLAYQLKQTMKPIEFFTNREEHRKIKIIFLSRQVSRMLGAFFQRGYGIAFVLSLTLTAHSLSCIRFLL